MEAAGLVASYPPVRSSDYGLCCQAPFVYFLCRRLGLVKALRWSKALSRGSWFHESFKHYRLRPDLRREKVEVSLELRQEELSSVCTQLGMSPDARRDVLLRERQDVETSLAWFDVAMNTPINKDWGSPLEFLNRSYWRVIAREARLVQRKMLFGKSFLCVAQPDLLLYHQSQNTVWIVDAKTTSSSPLLRATTCPYEFQTRHYMSITRHLMETGRLQRVAGLPEDARLGGMIHLIVRKPGIEFGMKDRHYELDTSPFKSGPRKGEPRNERRYFGEPVWENYLARVSDWYRCEGEYTHQRAEFEADPPVNMSVVSGSLIDEKCDAEQYMAQLQLISTWLHHKPDPYSFPMPSSFITFNRLDDYAPFIMNPPSAWPEIIRQEGWMQVQRDDLEFDPTQTDDVIPEPGSEFE